MSAILPSIQIDRDSLLAKYFAPYQALWIQADDFIHAQGKQAFVLAEKSVRIGWTYCDGFKNVRKRLHHRDRDYLFVTKDWPSSLEYMHQSYRFIEFFNLTRNVLSHGEDEVKIPRLDADGKPTALTEHMKIGYIKFTNGSRIIAFSSNPYAMTVYGGDVGIDEFAKHPNAALLWQTAQGRIAWNGDMAVWSSHDGEDTLFNQFVQQARASVGTTSTSSETFPLSRKIDNRDDVEVVPTASSIQNQNSKFKNGDSEAKNENTTLSHQMGEGPRVRVCSLSPNSTLLSPWNLYFRVTMPDAIELGLLDVINRVKGSHFTPEQFIADCRTRAGSEEIFEQSYMCNPQGSATASIVDWSSIERCRYEYEFERVHLEADQVLKQFGHFTPGFEHERQSQIHQFLRSSFPSLFSPPLSHPMGEGPRVRVSSSGNSQPSTKNPQLRLGSKSPPPVRAISP